MAYLFVAVGLLFWLILSWVLSSLLKLRGVDLWVFRGALAFIGIAAAGVLLWWLHRRRSTAAPGHAEDEIDFLVREAAQRLSRSPASRGGAIPLTGFPAALLVGAPASAKTSVVVQSGQESELLAGKVMDNGAVAPTTSANLWFSNGWVFAEYGGARLGDTAGFQRLLRQLQPSGIASWLGRQKQAPRALVAVIDCEWFYQPDAVSRTTALARQLQEQFLAAAEIWGSRVPVYVLFSKLDRVPYFTAFARRFDTKEIGQSLSYRLALDAQPVGTWAEWQTQRLSASFDEIILRLSEWRREMMRREAETEAPSDIYEFVREFRKLRDPLVRMLTELTRPNPLRATPVLRGFGFSGVRPVVVEDQPLKAAESWDQQSIPGIEATLAFQAKPAAAPQWEAPGHGGSKKVPQWIFLRDFFDRLVLRDPQAAGLSAQSTRAPLSQRILLAAASALIVIFLIGATISFFRNRAFIAEVDQTNNALARERADVLSRDKFTRLETLREHAAAVTEWEVEGAPLSRRWGLYPGHDLYEQTRAVYCGQLRRQLLDPVRGILQTRLAALPSTPGANDAYELPYQSLKAYLVMSSQPAHADAKFLSPFLWLQWSAGKNLDPDSAALVEKQFDFYSEQRAANFCPASADDATVEQARTYLLAFRVVDRAYQNILSELNEKNAPVKFGDPAGALLFRAASDAPITREITVEGAFSQAGWDAAQKAIRRAPDYLQREPWVLGADRGTGGMSSADLIRELQTRYQTGFIERWQRVLSAGLVANYSNIKDAANKLKRLSDPQTPLMGLFCFISQNTAVSQPEVVQAFQPLQSLTPPSTCASALIGGPNQNYMQSLANLQLGVERASDPAQPEPSLPEADPAKLAARTTAQGLNLPAPAAKLLEDPIIGAERLVKGRAPANANGQGAAFCTQIAPLMRSFPFNSRTEQQARPDEVNNVFQPNNGALWGFFNTSLQGLLAPMGPRYQPAPGAKVPVSDAFVRYFNHMADISRTFYRANAASPSFTYTLRVEPSPDLDSFELEIDGKKLKGSKRGGESQEFQWTPSSNSLTLTVKGKTLFQQGGPWAAWVFFNNADREQGGEGNGLFEWDLKESLGFGKKSISSAKSGTLRLSVDYKGGAPLFHRGYLETPCVSKIAR